MHTLRPAARLLIAEEEPGVRNLLSLALKHHGYSVDFTEDGADGVGQLRQLPTRYAAVLVDLTVCAYASELVEVAKALQPPIPVIGLLNGQSLKSDQHWSGVDQFVYKPINAENLRKALDACLATRTQNMRLAEEPSSASSEYGFSSVWRTEMQPMIKHVALSDIPVLVQGETGTGKEVMARQIHALSPRSKKLFLKVNCAALPSELIESELFGYERGAFTGAFKNNPGKFEMAEGGTILLDEIGDMDFKLQSKLLQVLQDREFIRLGSSEPRRVDVRVIAATHCDLERAIEEGRFREDLYYRLNIVTLRVPPLRERRDEVLPLANYFLRKHSSQLPVSVEISPALVDVMVSHDWPGNIRELENVMRKLLVLRRPDLVAEELRTRARRRSVSATATSSNQPVESMTKVPIAAGDSGEQVPYRTPPARMHKPDSKDIGLSTYSDGIGDSMNQDRPIYMASHSYDPVGTTRSSAVDNVSRWSILDRVDQARREAETEAILNALNSSLWNRKRAAEVLNIDYKALLYKMKKLGIVERAAKIAI